MAANPAIVSVNSTRAIWWADRSGACCSLAASLPLWSRSDEALADAEGKFRWIVFFQFALTPNKPAMLKQISPLSTIIGSLRRKL